MQQENPKEIQRCHKRLDNLEKVNKSLEPLKSRFQKWSRISAGALLLSALALGLAAYFYFHKDTRPVFGDPENEKTIAKALRRIDGLSERLERIETRPAEVAAGASGNEKTQFLQRIKDLSQRIKYLEGKPVKAPVGTSTSEKEITALLLRMDELSERIGNIEARPPAVPSNGDDIAKLHQQMDDLSERAKSSEKSFDYLGKMLCEVEIVKGRGCERYKDNR
ncbi:MAG: hypothetical protein GY862_14270 [Gammaproteobacteria bacterium]|nr:hypothetical protein [Gammaproteobacteria bacterium]